MTAIDAPVLAAPRGAVEAGAFRHAVVAVTVVPWVLLVGCALLSWRPSVVVLLGVVLGVPHVVATVGLYADPDLRDHRRAQVGRYGLAVGGVVAGTTAVFAVAPSSVLAVLVLAFLLWQIHHFTKQNVGMISFWHRARGTGSLSGHERNLVLATSLVGGLGVVRLLDVVPAADGALRVVGLASTAALAVAAVIVGRSGGSGHVAALLAAVAFYAPVHVLTVDLVTAALAYQAAHGAQYYLMVGHVVAPRRRVAAVTLVATALGGALLVFLASRDPLGPEAWMVGLAKGVVAAHFVADAGFWRLRDPQVRAYMRTRFRFL